jgi:hypothetical protein
MIFLAVALSLAGCLLQKQDLSEVGSSVNTGSAGAIVAKEKDQAGPFSIVTPTGSVLSLQDWYTLPEIETTLGKAQESATEILGAGSDTFAGSHILKKKYEGMEITFYSPKGNGETFMIQQISVDQPDFRTGNSIGIGSTSSEILEAYQAYPPNPSENSDSTVIQLRSPDNELISFALQDEKVVSLTLVYEFQ